MIKKVATHILSPKIEMSINTPMFKECDDLQKSLHEAFCLYIYEGNTEAGDWLCKYVIDFGRCEYPLARGTLEIDEQDHVTSLHGPFIE